MPPARRRVTRSDVARYAGVSGAVVSYVINNGPRRVSDSTAARVRNAIEVLGYQPNPSARALAGGSTRTLGLVLPDISNPFFGRLAAEIQLQAAARGYMVLIANSHGDPEIERQTLDELVNRQVDGLLLALIEQSTDRLAKLRGLDIGSVLIDCPQPVHDLRSIGADARVGAREAVTHLLEVHGHRSVALVSGQAVPGADLREQGWTDAHRIAGRPDGPIARTGYSRESGYEAAQRLLDAVEAPRAIFTSSDLQAIGVLRALHQRGLSVPDDVAVASFDGIQDARFTEPPLTVVQQPIPEMAGAALALLLDPDSGGAPTQQLHPMSLVVRESCGCPAIGPRSAARRGAARHRSATR